MYCIKDYNLLPAQKNVLLRFHYAQILLYIFSIPDVYGRLPVTTLLLSTVRMYRLFFVNTCPFEFSLMTVGFDSMG